jgi:hypothetical protein
LVSKAEQSYSRPTIQFAVMPYSPPAPTVQPLYHCADDPEPDPVDAQRA